MKKVLPVLFLIVLTPARFVGFGGQESQGEALSAGGYSIFHETLVDLSFEQVEEAARRNAVVLWPMGVIEQHGPHLPLGTDIYNSYLLMKQVARELRERGITVVIAPPFYWGINEVSGSFGGSFTVRPSTLLSLIEDIFFSLHKDGFQTVYIVTGHGDRLHNEVILKGVEKARSNTGLRGFVIVGSRMAERLGVNQDDAHILLLDEPSSPGPPPEYIEVHAGAVETSIVWSFFPELVRSELIPDLEPTRYGVDDLVEWRKGWDNARTKTPMGYFGDPASADPERGDRILRARAGRIAELIARHIEQSPWMRRAD